LGPELGQASASAWRSAWGSEPRSDAEWLSRSALASRSAVRGSSSAMTPMSSSSELASLRLMDRRRPLLVPAQKRMFPDAHCCSGRSALPARGVRGPQDPGPIRACWSWPVLQSPRSRWSRARARYILPLRLPVNSWSVRKAIR